MDKQDDKDPKDKKKPEDEDPEATTLDGDPPPVDPGDMDSPGKTGG